MNNLVKNLHFLRDIGYDFFLPKHLKVFIVKPESGDFNLLFWPLNDDLIVGSLLFDWKVGKSFSNQTTLNQCQNCQIEGVKNIHFLSDIGYDFFLPKHLKVFIVKPESGDFNLLFWPLNDDLVVGSLLFDWMVGQSF